MYSLFCGFRYFLNLLFGEGNTFFEVNFVSSLMKKSRIPNFRILCKAAQKSRQSRLGVVHTTFGEGSLGVGRRKEKACSFASKEGKGTRAKRGPKEEKKRGEALEGKRETTTGGKENNFEKTQDVVNCSSFLKLKTC